jgi:hypothetical protein
MKREPSAWRYNWATIFLGDINTGGPDVPGWGSLESETVKYGHESHRTQTSEWLRWWVPAAIVSDRPILSSQRAPHINKPETVWQQQKYGLEPQMGLDTKTDWPIDSPLYYNFHFDLSRSLSWLSCEMEASCQWWKHKSRRLSTVGNRHQAMTGEYIKTSRVLEYVIWGVCRSVKLLQLPVVTSYKSPINPVTNLNPVSSHHIMTIWTLQSSGMWQCSLADTYPSTNLQNYKMTHPRRM